jgi:hypothetical protein
MRGTFCWTFGACRLSRVSVVISRPDDFVMGPKPSAISEGVCPEDATETDETARARAHLIESVPVCATPNEHPKCIRLSFAIGSSIPQRGNCVDTLANLITWIMQPNSGSSHGAERAATTIDPETSEHWQRMAKAWNFAADEPQWHK